MVHVPSELEYFLGRTPTDDEVSEAEEWVQDHPHTGLNEWVEAMIEIGAL